MKKSFGLKFFFIALCPQLTEACKIAGSDTGICTDPSDFDILLPFCKVVVQYRACLPRYQALWYNHTPILKDTYVAQMHKKLVQLRKLHESNKTFHKMHSDEWDAGTNSIVNRFSDNPDCVNAFRNYFCWMSFPRCDTDGSSLPLCRSVCENFFLACKQSKDLWRCGDTAFVNGYKPKKSTQLTVSARYSKRHPSMIALLYRAKISFITEHCFRDPPSKIMHLTPKRKSHLLYALQVSRMLQAPGIRV